MLAAVKQARHKRRARHTSTGIELPRSDGRTIGARRYKTLVEDFTAEIGGILSAVDQNLVKQAANLTLACERMQADVVAGLDVDADSLVRISSEARRILGMLRARAAKRKPDAPTIEDLFITDEAATE